MIAVDTNILVYAHRDGFPQHAAARTRLQELARGRAPWGMPVFCVAEFLRVATHPRVLSPPTPMATAWEVLDRLLGSPSTRLLLPGPTFPSLLREQMEAGGARGNLVFNAQIAALCIEHGATRLLTADRDFARFPGIETVAL